MPTDPQALVALCPHGIRHPWACHECDETAWKAHTTPPPADAEALARLERAELAVLYDELRPTDDYLAFPSEEDDGGYDGSVEKLAEIIAYGGSVDDRVTDLAFAIRLATAAQLRASQAREAALREERQTEDEETYQIGKRDGYEFAVQCIDIETGGDGEYRYCTDHEDWPNVHCPDAGSMKIRIARRFGALEARATALERQLEEARAVLKRIAEGQRLDFGDNGAMTFSDYRPAEMARTFFTGEPA